MPIPTRFGRQERQDEIEGFYNSTTMEGIHRVGFWVLALLLCLVAIGIAGAQLGH